MVYNKANPTKKIGNVVIKKTRWYYGYYG